MFVTEGLNVFLGFLAWKQYSVTKQITKHKHMLQRKNKIIVIFGKLAVTVAVSRTDRECTGRTWAVSRSLFCSRDPFSITWLEDAQKDTWCCWGQSTPTLIHFLSSGTLFPVNRLTMKHSTYPLIMWDYLFLCCFIYIWLKCDFNFWQF